MHKVMRHVITALAILGVLVTSVHPAAADEPTPPPLGDTQMRIGSFGSKAMVTVELYNPDGTILNATDQPIARHGAEDILVRYAAPDGWAGSARIKVTGSRIAAVVSQIFDNSSTDRVQADHSVFDNIASGCYMLYAPHVVQKTYPYSVLMLTNPNDYDVTLTIRYYDSSGMEAPGSPMNLYMKANEALVFNMADPPFGAPDLDGDGDYSTLNWEGSIKIAADYPVWGTVYEFWGTDKAAAYGLLCGSDSSMDELAFPLFIPYGADPQKQYTMIYLRNDLDQPQDVQLEIRDASYSLLRTENVHLEPKAQVVIDSRNYSQYGDGIAAVVRGSYVSGVAEHHDDQMGAAALYRGLIWRWEKTSAFVTNVSCRGNGGSDRTQVVYLNVPGNASKIYYAFEIYDQNGNLVDKWWDFPWNFYTADLCERISGNLDGTAMIYASDRYGGELVRAFRAVVLDKHNTIHSMGASVVDPAPILYASGSLVQDTWLNSQSPDTNYGGSSNFKIYQPDVDHALIKFDLSDIPAGATINNAYLYLHTTVDGEDGETQVIDIHRVKVNWDQMQATWNERLTGVSWEQPGASGAGDIDLTPAGTITVTATSTDFESTDLSSLVQGWVDGTYPNHGVLLKAPSGSWTWYNFYSSNSADPWTKGPRLVVLYTEPE